MAKGPKPFKYRDKWRATVTLSNRTRPTKDFEKYDDAVQWIAEQLANADSLCAPELGGPRQLQHSRTLCFITPGSTRSTRAAWLANSKIQPLRASSHG